MSPRVLDPTRLPASIRALNAITLAACPDGERGVLAEALDARATHRRAGRAAVASGAAWEAWLEDQHALAIGAGLLAWVGHYGPLSVPWVDGGRVQTDARGRLLLATMGPGPVDYLGCGADGRVVAIEAKRRMGRLHLRGGDHDALPDHQRAMLEATHDAGGIAIVAVELVRQRDGAPTPLRYAVPWHVVRGLPSLGADELVGWEIEPSRPGGYLARWLLAPGGAP